MDVLSMIQCSTSDGRQRQREAKRKMSLPGSSGETFDI